MRSRKRRSAGKRKKAVGAVTMYLIAAAIIGMLALTITHRKVYGMDKESVQASKLVALVALYTNSLSSMESNGSVSIELDTPMDVDVIEVGIADIDRFKRRGRVFASPGHYVSAVPYDENMEKGKRTQDIKILGKVKEAKLEAVTEVTLKKYGKKVEVTGR